LPFGTHHGARLRIGGGSQESSAISGDSAWQTLATPFAVEQPVREVELICEFRVHAGEAWYDLKSLRILRIDDL
jgi:hypothetical protein